MSTQSSLLKIRIPKIWKCRPSLTNVRIMFLNGLSLVSVRTNLSFWVVRAQRSSSELDDFSQLNNGRDSVLSCNSQLLLRRRSSCNKLTSLTICTTNNVLPLTTLFGSRKYIYLSFGKSNVGKRKV